MLVLRSSIGSNLIWDMKFMDQSHLGPEIYVKQFQIHGK